MNNYNWIIEWMTCKPTDGNNSNVVVMAGWRLNGDDGNNHFATIYSTCTFPEPDVNGTFIPYESLTQNTVLEWIWANGVDKNAAEATIDNQINTIVNPPVIQPPLPWAVDNP